jgi:hypothetical protein
MLEWTHGDAPTLHADLTLANASAWQQYGIAMKLAFWQKDIEGFYYVLESPIFGKPKLRLSKLAAGLPPYFRFVRAGAVRIGATSNSRDHPAVAFRNSNGMHVVVVQAKSPGSIAVSGLPPGTFGLRYTTSTEAPRELPDLSIAQGETAKARMPAPGTIAFYQKRPNR